MLCGSSSMEKFESIIEDTPIGIDREQIFKIIERMLGTGDFSDLAIVSSNASSALLLSEEKDEVYHYFKSTVVANKICGMLDVLSQDRTGDVRLIVSSGFGRRAVVRLDQTISYDIFTYVSSFSYYVIDLNMVVWKKLKPLNMMQGEILGDFVCRNVVKLLWDIGHALYGLHNKYGLVHNDCRIDNIGITNKGNFALFDLDGTVFVGERGIFCKKDYTTLLASIDFVTGSNCAKNIFNPSESLNLMTEMIKFVVREKGLGYQEAFQYLECLTIV